MDPRANIKRQIELAKEIVQGSELLYKLRDSEFPEFDSERAAEVADAYENAAFELAELVIALDGWRKTGGFDPYGIQDLGADDRRYDDWQLEVMNGDTRLGFDAWAAHQDEFEAER